MIHMEIENAFLNICMVDFFVVCFFKVRVGIGVAWQFVSLCMFFFGVLLALAFVLGCVLFFLDFALTFLGSQTSLEHANIREGEK